MALHATLAKLRAFFIGGPDGKSILFLFLLAFTFSASGETPLISDNSAAVTESGTRGICVLCSVSDADHLVENSMQLNATFSLPVGVLGSAYACVGADRTFPAGRRAGFVASLNNGVASLLDGSTLTTRLGGSVQESLSGPGSLATVIGIGNDLNMVPDSCRRTYFQATGEARRTLEGPKCPRQTGRHRGLH